MLGIVEKAWNLLQFSSAKMVFGRFDKMAGPAVKASGQNSYFHKRTDLGRRAISNQLDHGKYQRRDLKIRTNLPTTRPKWSFVHKTRGPVDL